MIELKNKICGFNQLDGEAFNEAWERFKLLLTQCSRHQFMFVLLKQVFYDGLHMKEQTMIDNVVGGYFGDKTTEEIWDIYVVLATNSQ